MKIRLRTTNGIIIGIIGVVMGFMLGNFFLRLELNMNELILLFMLLLGIIIALTVVLGMIDYSKK